MNDAYLPYQTIDFAQDEAFIDWVKEGRAAEKWQQWLAAHPEKKATVEEARQLVQVIRVKESKPTTGKVEAIWSNIDAATELPQQTTTVRRVWLRRMAYVAAAASVALILFFYFFNPVTPERIYANRGEIIEHTLPDGSVVTLSAASEMLYTPKEWEKQRTLKLQGEAFFEVTEGSQFTVQTDRGNVAVLGTSFNVNARANTFSVACFTGRVAVFNEARDSVILNPTEGVRLNAQAQAWESYSLDITRSASWRNGIFYYENESLDVVYEEVERQFDVTIQAADSILEMPYTGFFERNNLDSALYQINWPMGLESEIQGDVIEIKALE